MSILNYLEKDMATDWIILKGSEYMKGFFYVKECLFGAIMCNAVI